MKTKLTLSIDGNIIEEAKLYAKKNSLTLSLTPKKIDKPSVSPLVESLTGVISYKTEGYKKEYADYLSKKYS